MKNKYKKQGLIIINKWFAWYPVNTDNAGWIWLKTVDRKIDERDEYYLGLLPKYSYFFKN